MVRSDLVSKAWLAVTSQTGTLITTLAGFGWLTVIAVKSQPKQLEQHQEPRQLVSDTKDEAVVVADSFTECPDRWLHELADAQGRKVWE